MKGSPIHDLGPLLPGFRGLMVPSPRAVVGGLEEGLAIVWIFDLVGDQEEQLAFVMRLQRSPLDHHMGDHADMVGQQALHAGEGS